VWEIGELPVHKQQAAELISAENFQKWTKKHKMNLFLKIFGQKIKFCPALIYSAAY